VLKKYSDIEATSSDDTDSEASSPISGPLPFPSIPPPPASKIRRNRSEDEVEEDIITISGKQSIYASKLTI